MDTLLSACTVARAVRKAKHHLGEWFSKIPGTPPAEDGMAQHMQEAAATEYCCDSTATIVSFHSLHISKGKSRSISVTPKPSWSPLRVASCMRPRLSSFGPTTAGASSSSAQNLIYCVSAGLTHTLRTGH